jgi:NADP-dependent 3-hydroxy acid dehydrogenase YdfG
MAVYAGTKNAVRAITEGLRLEAAGKLRVTGISHSPSAGVDFRADAY